MKAIRTDTPTVVPDAAAVVATTTEHALSTILRRQSAYQQAAGTLPGAPIRRWMRAHGRHDLPGTSFWLLHLGTLTALPVPDEEDSRARIGGLEIIAARADLNPPALVVEILEAEAARQGGAW